MFLEKIKAQPTIGEINVIIEIPMNTNSVKYEFDKEAAAIKVDRFMQTAMFYPCNYGFIPNTLSGDGDPVDVLVACHYSVVPSTIIKSRPIGVLIMEDDCGIDEKIIAVPVSKLDATFDSILDLEDLNPIFKHRITHFFEHYKDLEEGKWVKITNWEGSAKAKQLIEEGIKRHLSVNS